MKNLNVNDGTVVGTGVSYCGGVVGYASNSTIENCSSSVNVSGMCAGGVVGGAYSSNLIACHASGNVTGIDAVAENVSSNVSVGGIVGEITYVFTIKASYYTTGIVTGGKVMAEKKCFVGGIAGSGSYTGSVSNSYSTGNVAGESTSYIGALIGYNQNGDNHSNLLYVTGRGATKGIGDKSSDSQSIKAVASDKVLENITWLNTNLPGEIGWSFKADGTLMKAN